MNKRPEKDTKNPPGQIVNPILGADTLLHNIEEWKKYEESKKQQASERMNDTRTKTIQGF